MTTKTQYEQIQLNPRLPNRVHVVDEKRKQFVMTMEQAVKACHAYNSQIAFSEQFQNLLSYVAEWWDARTNAVSRALITVRDTGLLLVLVQRKTELDLELESDVTSLVSDVINDERFNLIRLEVLALPACEPDEVTSFVDPRVTVELNLDAK
jgi:hypothetical protein